MGRGIIYFLILLKMEINTKKHGKLWCLNMEALTKAFMANDDIEKAFINACQQGILLKMENGKATTKLLNW